MTNIKEDKEYYNIVKEILENKNYQRIKTCKHHGISRLDHSIRVSYNAYKYAKKHNLDYISVARGGLLHDFFITNDLTKKDRKYRFIIHPYKALENASKYFKPNEKEKNIILTHMFPTLPHKIPKYKESFIVSIIDKKISIKELFKSILNGDLRKQFKENHNNK